MSGRRPYIWTYTYPRWKQEADAGGELLCKVGRLGLTGGHSISGCRGNVIVRPRCQSAPFITCLRARLHPYKEIREHFQFGRPPPRAPRARSSFPGSSSIGCLSERITAGASMMQSFILGDKMQIKQLC